MNDKLGTNKDSMDEAGGIDDDVSELDAGAVGKWGFAASVAAGIAGQGGRVRYVGEDDAFNPGWAATMGMTTDDDGRLLPFVSAGAAYWEDDGKPYVEWPSGGLRPEISGDNQLELENLRAAVARALDVALWYDEAAAREIRDGSSVAYSIYAEAARMIRRAMGGV